MAYDLKTLGQYGYAPIGSLKDMIHEAISQLAAIGKTRNEIAEILEVSYATVCKYVVEAGIEVSSMHRGGKLNDKTIHDLEKLQDGGLSTPQIAKIWGVSVSSIYRWEERHRSARKRLLAERRKGVAR